MRPSMAELEAAFLEALEVAPERRAEHVATHATSAFLRREVLSLLAASDEPGPLDRIRDRLAGGLPPPGTAAERDLSPQVGRAEQLRAGSRVERYRVEHLIAEGGMGSVYRAVRADGEVEYPVALKLLRPELHTPAWQRRFLSERNVQAAFGHPGIARLLDAGTTSDGRPWFAMELVDGVPITEYCDARGLDVRKRLELFGSVCSAVQHAHRHLVVHRDIKPRNVLVADDGTVKLLDFGISKILDPDPESERAAPTVPHLRIFTPDYAAPEQILGRAVSTVTDIYQLALLLHVLLTGRLPAQSAGSEPGHGISPEGRLRDGRRMPADLRAILERALAVAPSERYGTVEQLSDDVRRHLTGLPVSAREGRLAYHLSKLIRRHKAVAASAATVLVLIVAFSWSSMSQARSVSVERDRAREVSRLLTEMFEAARPAVARGSPPDAIELLDLGADRVRTSAGEDPELAAMLFGVLADIQHDLARYPDAIALGWSAVNAWDAVTDDRDPRAVERLARVAASLGAAQMTDSAAVVADLALARAPWRSGAPSVVRARALQARAYAHQLEGEAEPAAALLDSAIALYRRAPGDSARLALASALVNRGWLHENAGRLDTGIALLEESLAIRMELLDADHPSTINSLGGLAALRLREGDPERAEPMTRQAVERSRRYYGPDHPYLGGALLTHAKVLERLGELTEAEETYREALGALRAAEHTLGRAQAFNDFGLFLLHRRARPTEAALHFEEAVEAFGALRGPRDPWTAVALGNLAAALLADGRAADAARTSRDAIEALEDGGDATRRWMGAPLTTLGLALSDLGRPREASLQLRRARASARAASDSLALARAELALGLLRYDAAGSEAIADIRKAWATFDRHASSSDPLRARARPLLETSGGTPPPS